MKKKVKMLESIAGLADPDRDKLDREYAQIMERARVKADAEGREFKPGPVKLLIEERKKNDRYNDVIRGFKKDFAFKPGEEVLIPAAIAAAWEEAGLCVIIEDHKKAAA